MSWLIRRAIVPAVMLSAAALAAPARGNDVTEPALVRQPPAVVTEPALAPQPPAAVTEPALVPQAPAAAAGQAYGTRARILEAVRPEYPLHASRRWQEGWVQLSFTIRPDGTVADPIVEDSTGIVEFERAAIAAILKTRCQPATWQGQPVEQGTGRFTYQFTLQGEQIGARRAFARSWRKAEKLMQEQHYDEAAAVLYQLDHGDAWSNYEIAQVSLMRARLQAATGDQAGQLRSLQRASVSGGSDLPAEQYRQTLLQRFLLEVQLSQFGAALATYEVMKSQKPSLADQRVERAVAGINRVIDSQEALGFTGVVGFRSGLAEGRPNWQHELLRRTFKFDAIDGEVGEFVLNCDWKRMVDKVSLEKTWTVPVNWGWCQIFVYGAQGAKVNLVELPLAAGEKGIRRQPEVVSGVP